MLGSFFETVIAAIYRFINRWRVWYRLPFPLAVINLLALRVDLRWRNLFDTETAPLDPPVPDGFDIRHCRTADGAFNDLSETTAVFRPLAGTTINYSLEAVNNWRTGGRFSQ